MYSLQQFGYMVRDPVRIKAFDAALRRTVKPGSVVVDIGTGTGIFAVMACKYGAKHVYAVDPNPLITLGPQMAAANGCADRITFIHDVTERVTLPEQADVILGDIHGRLPSFEAGMSTFRDARERLLKPGGVLIPERDEISATFISDPARYDEEVLRPWVNNLVDVKMDGALNIITNTMMFGIIPPQVEMLSHRRWMTLDYTTSQIETFPMSWTITEPATLHFAVVWFACVLHDDISFSNALGRELTDMPQMYQRSILPLREPVTVAPGDTLTLELKHTRFNDQYLLAWTSQVTAAGATTPRVRLVQNAFQSIPLFELKKRAAGYRPKLSHTGRMTARALALMDSGEPLSVIAAALQAEFSAVFPDQASALSFAASICQQYSD